MQPARGHTRNRAPRPLLGPSRPGPVTVVAPIDGTALRRYATVGAQVEPGGAPLLEIGDKTALWVVADVFEDDLSQVRPGTAVQLRFPADPRPVAGRVVGVGALVDVGQRRAPVYIALADDTAAHKLSPACSSAPTSPAPPPPASRCPSRPS
ncbi:HlyD family secretion protein [Nannocystis exedens]|uniref:HlyD family secretion protein n=1 Tax=Nannocystis exedens TaxID=54 RepID=A0A1I2CRG2_9BACT|nr:HlyD family efflux transporter periplasmic adaptor subunit [Nannocystis exedens]PCC68514.1 cobalt-zinc-cadmium resistance protein [Nannocystis exedens]SFE70969.1 HlyD family secretion protein [Nannocystis exedens]